jgi:hypothetical protein
MKCKPYANYNGPTLSGMTKIGNIAVATSNVDLTSAHWWNGPDEDLGYCICGERSGQEPIQFWRSKNMTDESFLDLLSRNFHKTFSDMNEANLWLMENGYYSTTLEVESNQQWYGIQYDLTQSSPTLTRIASDMTLHSSLPVHNLLKACILNDDLTVNYYLDPNDWNKKLDGTASKLDGTDGQVMIRKTSKTYWKYETIDNITTIKCSCYPIPGFIESDIWNVGAYEAALQRSTLKLSSVKNNTVDYRGGNNSNWDDLSKSLLGKPVTNVNRTKFRTYARNRGTGWNQIDYDMYKEIVWLFCIEYATFNSQLAVNDTLTAEGYKQGGLGPGVTTVNSTEWNNFNGYNPFVNCGSSDSLNSSTGQVSVDIVDLGGSGITRTVSVPRYRGIENPFGHIWTWIDGVNVYNYEANVIHDTSNFADNITGETIGIISNIDGWCKNLINGHEILASTVGGNNSTYMCDYMYRGSSTSTWYALLVGGSALLGTAAGLFYASTYSGAADAATYVGGRLQARNYDYQGLMWNSSTDSYTRLGSISDVAISKSAGNERLPIQSKMKRVMLNDDLTVNYYVDLNNPLLKNGSTSIISGITTTTSINKLIDTTKDFVNLGVKAGNYVHNLTDDTWSIIRSVTTNTLELALDIMISGKTYEIGDAVYNGDDGQVMTEIPKFYYKQSLDGNNHYWYISEKQLAGYKVHPAFIVDGVEVNKQYIGSFEGSMYDASSSGMTTSGNTTVNMYAAGDKLCSIAGWWPKTNERCDDFRNMGTTRGTGWRHQSYYLYSAIQLLYLIEYANFNSQTMISVGRTNLSGGAWLANSYIGMTGFSVKDGNSSGGVANGGTSGYMTDYMTYRGIENIFGNVYKFVDGIAWDSTLNDTTSPIPVWVTNNIANYSYTSSEGKELLIYANNIGSTNQGWSTNIHDCVGFIPSAVGGSSTTKLCDYYYQQSSNGNGWRALLVGGSAYYGTVAGLFSANANVGAADAYTHVGGRLQA